MRLNTELVEHRGSLSLLVIWQVAYYIPHLPEVSYESTRHLLPRY